MAKTTKLTRLKKAYRAAYKAAAKGSCRVAKKNLKRADKLHDAWAADGRKAGQTRGAAERVALRPKIVSMCGGLSGARRKAR